MTGVDRVTQQPVVDVVDRTNQTTCVLLVTENAENVTKSDISKKCARHEREGHLLNHTKHSYFLGSVTKRAEGSGVCRFKTGRRACRFRSIQALMPRY